MNARRPVDRYERAIVLLSPADPRIDLDHGAIERDGDAHLHSDEKFGDCHGHRGNACEPKVPGMRRAQLLTHIAIHGYPEKLLIIEKGCV